MEGEGIRLLDTEEIEHVPLGEIVGTNSFERNICSLYDFRITSETAKGLIINFERMEFYLG